MTCHNNRLYTFFISFCLFLFISLVSGSLQIASAAGGAAAALPESSFNNSAIRVKKSGGDSNNAVYQEEVVDIEVKVLGGMVKHTRFIKGGAIQFNPNWANIDLHFYEDNETFFPDFISRNNFNYTRQGEGNTYVFDERNYIVKTDEGYTWKNRKGDSIDYDNDGTTLNYSNKNDLKVYFTRDAESRISTVKDHNNDLVLTFEYSTQGWLEKVTDSSNRSVSYEFNNISIPGGLEETGISSRGIIRGGQLSKVIDVLGNEWLYEYRGSVLAKRTSPGGQEITVFYRFLSPNSIIGGIEQPPEPPQPFPKAGGGGSTSVSVCTSWTAGSWSKGANGWSQEIKCLASSSGGGGGGGAALPPSPEDKPPYVIESIYANEERIRHYTYLYNKNKKRWLRGVEDGDQSLIVTEVNEDGDLLSLNRNGRIIETTTIEGTTYTTVDENKNKTITRKDAYKNPIQVTYADGSKITTTYNTNFSIPTSETDENGVITSYEYDSNGNLLKMTEAAGTAEEIITKYTYNNLGQGTQILRADGRVELWTYDNKGNVATYTDGEGHITQYQDYDALGNPGKVIDGRGNTTEYIYNAAGAVTQIKTPLGHIAKYEYDGRGNLTKITDANNNATTLAYDLRDRLTSITNALNEAMKFKYNSRGYIIQITDEAGKVSKIEYDLDGNIVKTTDGNNNAIEQDFGYLNLKPYKSLLNEVKYPSGYSTLFEYDNRNRPISEVDQAEGEADRERRYRYDAVGNLIQFTDPRGNVAKSFYDAHNRVVKYEDREQNNTVLAYDVHHNLNKVTNAKNNDIRRYEYNNRDEVVKEILPDNAEYQTSYDANGNVTQQIDAKGQVSVYEYDADNRLTTSRTFADISQITDNANAQKTISYGYDVIDRLTSYDDGITSGSYGYDAADRLLSFTINYGSFSKTSSYTYYPNGKKKSFTGPDGKTIGYGYDNNNQLQTVSIPGQGSITVNENNWLVPKTVTYPGGIKQNHEYDGYLRAKKIKTTKTDNSALLEHQYQYDAYDNVTVQNILSGSRTGQSNYSYDKKDRLTQYNIPSFGAISASTIALGYDELGNRITDSRDSDPATWQYDNRDRLKQRGKLSYSYDANGSLISITHADNGLQRSFVYNFENRLIEVKDGPGQTISTYQYDPFGRRISKTVNDVITYFFNAAEGMVAEMTASGQINTQYGYRPDSTWGTNPLFIKQGGYTGYYQNDHLGTPQQIVSSSGQILWDAHYSAFGLAVVTTNTVTNNLRLAGQYYDQETNLHYNYFRYYDPSIGRYVTSDPIGLAGGINTYGYGYGNPMYWIDPFGLCGFDAWDLLMFVPVGGAAFAVGRGVFKLGKWGYKAWKAKRKAPKFCSFDGEMEVLTTDGYKKIKDITIEDEVLSRDANTGEHSFESVVAQYSNEYQETVYITIKDIETGQTQVITSNKIHPFFVKVPENIDLVPPSSEGHNYVGIIENGHWVDASNLKPGFLLLNNDKTFAEVIRVRVEEKPLKAYNLTVDLTHTYFVKGDGEGDAVWVHNTCELKGKKIKGNKRANDHAQKLGYDDAHQLKREYVGNEGPKFDMFFDKTTGNTQLANKAQDNVINIIERIID